MSLREKRMWLVDVCACASGCNRQAGKHPVKCLELLTHLNQLTVDKCCNNSRCGVLTRVMAVAACVFQYFSNTATMAQWLRQRTHWHLICSWGLTLHESLVYKYKVRAVGVDLSPRLGDRRPPAVSRG